MNQISITTIPELEKRLSGKGILTVWVDWSIGKYNCKRLYQFLEERKYPHPVYEIDIDIFPHEKQLQLLGIALHGWGEIFVFDNGKIISSYLGKDSFEKFKL